MGSLRVQREPDFEGAGFVVPNEPPAYSDHGEPGGEHAMEFVRWKEEGRLISLFLDDVMLIPSRARKGLP
jgi:hypothetical protein